MIACFTLVLGMTCITLFKPLSLPSCGLTTWLNNDFGFFLAPFTPPLSICLFFLLARHALNWLLCVVCCLSAYGSYEAFVWLTAPWVALSLLDFLSPPHGELLCCDRIFVFWHDSFRPWVLDSCFFWDVRFFRISFRFTFMNAEPLFFLGSSLHMICCEFHFHQCWAPILFRVFLSSKIFWSFSTMNAEPLFVLGSSFLPKCF
jgi:hypothetical protein